jgi:hypothetical protein
MIVNPNDKNDLVSNKIISNLMQLKMFNWILFYWIIIKKTTHKMVFFFIDHIYIYRQLLMREFLISVYNIFVQDMNLREVYIIENLKQAK